ncbi:hypothetical protein SAMN05660826_00165 [Caldanaerovirga acetigignens]|jgi:hypothetical protein|uniref:Uncharacterized protein n=2 Tax=Caldanaerovirga acetigignens TaxID=447595 RepID=A0A1M7FW58_9FIRM|nr:DUF5665 domain-containing protein [Caldanaerovirga acetigignens]SHM07927.1 hypothetical protein SAMN05660826_00165 [Caldanaerovirga acetigignens]
MLMERERENLIRELSLKIDELSVKIEKLNLSEYLELFRNPKRLLYLNFLAGVARGFGMAVGFTLLGALALYILQRVVILNLPLIGDFIAELVRIVQDELSVK